MVDYSIAIFHAECLGHVCLQVSYKWTTNVNVQTILITQIDIKVLGNVLVVHLYFQTPVLDSLCLCIFSERRSCRGGQVKAGHVLSTEGSQSCT